ncbi:hypothetical protein [Curtobacterium sp. VKM Ac-2922]|uniref:hypothetical protein n=1 Tax=Curtobacterium sp. VKM Ac-2922 TaxID=2929475 RepID=UPI001FB308A1|nr:hypothetical protein [Curtobacterium sp. VKM Ac-2922]MCJ1714538.1 hypothetical protein [Curtobacterium sp. VKM Ac-2922]
MWTTIMSVGIAGVAAFCIPLLVRTTVRRNDLRRAAQRPPNRPEDGPLVVRLRTWQWVVWRVLGALFVIVGGFYSIVSVLGTEPSDDPAPTIAAVAILLAGVGALVLARSLRRTRITATPDAVLVRRGLRAERTVPIASIAAVRPLANAYGGIDARDADGRRLFTVMGLALGYAEFEQFLAERVVEPRRTAPAAPGPNGYAVPTWRGAGIAADWTLLALGSRRGPQPVIRIHSDAGDVALHLAEGTRPRPAAGRGVALGAGGVPVPFGQCVT